MGRESDFGRTGWGKMGPEVPRERCRRSCLTLPPQSKKGGGGWGCSLGVEG